MAALAEHRYTRANCLRAPIHLLRYVSRNRAGTKKLVPFCLLSSPWLQVFGQAEWWCRRCDFLLFVVKSMAAGVLPGPLKNTLLLGVCDCQALCLSRGTGSVIGVFCPAFWLHYYSEDGRMWLWT